MRITTGPMDADVVVVGAGAAGLAAALALAKGRFRVIVLEGRDRVGGRVMWKSVGSVNEPAELGAEFIHGAAPETSALLREAGLAKIETGDASWLCGADGELRPENDDPDLGELFGRVRSLPQDESVDAFLRRFDDDPHMREQARHARTFVEGFEAADPALASTRSIAEEIRTGVDSASWRPIGSYAPLFDRLVSQCVGAGVDLRLRTAVERIEWERGHVTLEASEAMRGTGAVRARCAIITVPVGVLRQGRNAARFLIAPPLPAVQQSALLGLEMGHAVRVVVAYRKAFWEEVAGGRYRDAAFFRCEGGVFNAFWTQLPLRGRTIVAWAGGPRATALNGMPEQQRIERARDEFGSIFAQRDLARREFEAGVTHDWSMDPFACGAYSYVATGAGAARSVLGEPVDQTLFFAGEATATDGQGGTVSGAFETGMRAAREAAQALEVAAAPRGVM